MQSQFDILAERLLRGGVARRHVRRYVTELRDHLDDLIGEERRAGCEIRDAEASALAKLGSPEVLAEAMISRRALRAWSAKAPVATYLIAPSLALALCTALGLAAVVISATWLRSAGGIPSDPPSWLGLLASGVVVFSNAILSILLGWIVGAMAIRQRSSVLWPMLGIIVLAAVGSAIQVGVTLPSATRHGEIELSPTLGTSIAQCVGYAGRLVLNLALTLTPYLGLSLVRAGRGHALV